MWISFELSHCFNYSCAKFMSNCVFSYERDMVLNYFAWIYNIHLPTHFYSAFYAVVLLFCLCLVESWHYHWFYSLQICLTTSQFQGFLDMAWRPYILYAMELKWSAVLFPTTEMWTRNSCMTEEFYLSRKNQSAEITGVVRCCKL